jgi:hypothetical protein
LNVFLTHGLADESSKSTGKSVGSHGSEQEESVESLDFFVGFGEISDFGLFFVEPFLPLEGINFQTT